MFDNFIKMEILTKVFFKNSVENYLKALVYFLVVIVILRILQETVLNRLRKNKNKTKNGIDSVIIKIVSDIKPKFYILFSIYLALKILILPNFLVNLLNSLFILAIIFQLTKFLRVTISFVVNKFNSEEGNEEHNENIANILGTITIFFVWVLGILMILSNLGINISSLLAGVGIGGVAIAFALKEILADLFASISIYFDKPFKIGDSISVDGKTGIVERVGLKTTRIRANSEEEIIFSNKDLTSSCIHNFKKSENKKIKFSIKIARSNSIEKLKKINDIIKEIIENVENAEFSKSYFKSIDDWANIFEITYKINSQDSSFQSEIQQKINFQICERFSKEGIELAIPTQINFESKIEK